jgi:hypothetical protein
VRVAPVPDTSRHPVARALAEALCAGGCPVTGASVMPVIPNAPLQATVLAVAERAADLITGCQPRQLAKQERAGPIECQAAEGCGKGCRYRRWTPAPVNQTPLTSMIWLVRALSIVIE